MKKIIFFLVFIPSILIKAQSNFNFNIDFASFKYDSTSNYVEFYYSFPTSQMKLVNQNNKLQVEGLFRLQIKDDKTGKYLVNKDWRIPNEVQDSSSITNKSTLMGEIGFVIPDGNYTCYAEGSDRNNPVEKQSYSFPVNEKAFGNNEINVSGIQLASSIKQEDADKNSIFYKNTLEVIPSPSAIYGDGSPVLYYYGELYNLDKAPDLSGIKFNVFVFDQQGKNIYSHNKKIIKPLPAVVEVGVINISRYISGKYTLVLSLSDSLKKQSVISRKEFFVYNPAVKDTNTTFSSKDIKVLSSQFAFLSSEECDDLFAKSAYIATDKEKDQYEKIHTVEGKREFLYKFWSERESDQSGNEKVSYTDYMNRVNIAAKRFKNISRAGWKTDMGRVYIKYGEPSEIERFPNEGDKRPYEIWHYNNIEGGVIFIFGDLTGFSNYVLLTSTKRGETEDPNWQKRITPSQ